MDFLMEINDAEGEDEWTANTKTIIESAKASAVLRSKEGDLLRYGTGSKPPGWNG